jgi:hypothetical protein
VVADDAKLLVETSTGELGTKTSGMRQCSVVLQGYGEGADDILHKVVLSLGKPGTQLALFTSGLSPVTAGPLLDISALVDTEIEERFVQDLDVLVKLSDSFYPELAVEVVSISEKIGSPSQLPDYEIDREFDA